MHNFDSVLSFEEFPELLQSSCFPHLSLFIWEKKKKREKKTPSLDAAAKSAIITYYN